MHDYMQVNVSKLVIIFLIAFSLAIGGIYLWRKSQVPNKDITDIQVPGSEGSKPQQSQIPSNWFEFAKQAKTEAECEQISSLETVKDNCYLSVAEITKDISLCEKAGTWKELCRSRLSETNTKYSEQQAKAIISSRATEVITTLKANNFVKLSTYIHPEKGVRFSPSTYINIENDLVFSADQIKNISLDQKKYVWGVHDGSGLPIEEPFVKYFEEFVYSHDFANAKEIGYNRSIGGGNTINNVFDSYPKSIVVEYHFPGFDPKYEGMDWESLRLVFEESNGIWYLVGVVHAQWTI